MRRKLRLEVQVDSDEQTRLIDSLLDGELEVAILTWVRGH